MAEVFELPTDVDLTYFAEGGANIIYRFNAKPHRTTTPPTEADLHNLPQLEKSSTPPPSSITPRGSPDQSRPSPVYSLLHAEPPPLLRVRKDLPHLPPVQAQYDYYVNKIAPLFPPETVLVQHLIRFPEHLPDILNATLAAAENPLQESPTGPRPSKRHGIYVPQTSSEPHGVLIDDLTPQKPSQLLLELKPKWLAQSPTAPKGATRCRTCALRAMRRAAIATESLKGNKAQLEPASNPAVQTMCPLDLGSGEPAAIGRAINSVLRAHKNDTKLKPDVLGMLRTATVDFLQSSPILPRLKELQMQLDYIGVLDLFEPAAVEGGHSSLQVPEDFLIATTIRDCTLFLCIDLGLNEQDNAPSITDVRLGDLDLKQPERGKIAYWRGVETDLIKQGWYRGRGGTVGCRLEEHDIEQLTDASWLKSRVVHA